MNYFQLLTDLVTLTGFAPLPLNHFVLKRTLNHLAKLAWLGPRSSKSKVLDSKWTHGSSDNFINKISLPKWNKFLYKNVKLVSSIFIKFLFFDHMIALRKLWKMLFISSKQLFSFSRYPNFCITVLPPFSVCQPLL